MQNPILTQLQKPYHLLRMKVRVTSVLSALLNTCNTLFHTLHYFCIVFVVRQAHQQQIPQCIQRIPHSPIFNGGFTQFATNSSLQYYH